MSALLNIWAATGSMIVAFIIAVIVGAGLPLAIAVFLSREKWSAIAALLVSLAMVGACAGVLGGMSRTGVVGDITSAFLGIIGGLAAYLFGLKQERGLIASFGAAALALSLGVGYGGGAYARLIPEDHRHLRDICAKAVTDAKLMSDPVAYKRFYAVLAKSCSRALTWNLPK